VWDLLLNRHFLRTTCSRSRYSRIIPHFLEVSIEIIWKFDGSGWVVFFFSA